MTGAATAQGESAPPAIPPRAAFVVGLARSGTTLLQRLLDGHPALLVMRRESHASDWCSAPNPADAFLEWRKRDREFFDAPADRDALLAHLRARLPGPSPVPEALRALVEGIVRIRPPAPGCAAWVEKTPKHLWNTPELLGAFGPATRFVHVVRDPRAVMASQFERWERGKPLHVRTFAARWAAADHLARTFERAHPEFIAVRYEDLVRETEAVMRRVAGHLGIEWHPILAEPTDDAAPWGGNSSTKEKVSGVSAASLDRWAEQLEPAHLDLLERLLAPRMRGRGYEPRSPSADRPDLRRAWVELVARCRIGREA